MASVSCSSLERSAHVSATSQGVGELLVAWPARSHGARVLGAASARRISLGLRRELSPDTAGECSSPLCTEAALTHRSSQ